jgi:hypothetical protein
VNRRDFLNSATAMGATALTAYCERGLQTKSLSLVEPGRTALVMAESEGMPAATHFISVMEQLTNHEPEIQSGKLPGGSRAAVVIGDIQTNGTVRELAGARGSKMTPQGILLLTMSYQGQPVLLLAGGSPAATPGAVGELLNFHLDAGPDRATVPELDLVDNPALPYRIFWTWDHSTIWVRGVPGEQEHGCANPYMKRAQDYLNDYRRIADFSGEHKLNGLIIWGFLRDRHGGVSTSKELVDYASERGVHVLPGIGTMDYGGFYYQGKNRFNLDTWLAQNPTRFRYLDGKGNRLKDILCPSRPENLRWLREGAEWLFSEFGKLGGANLENGDWETCRCDDCRRNRQIPGNDPNYYYDMAVTQLPIIEVAQRLHPKAWMVYATYTGFNSEEIWKRTDKSLLRSSVPKFVSKYPDTAICQWTYTFMVDGWGREPEAQVRKKWPSGLRPPTKHSVGLLHQGSQWTQAPDIWWTKSTRGNNTGQRYVDISELIRYTCTRCAEEGLEGLEIQGEVSDDSPANELNYLAFEEFTWHPHVSMDDFVRNRLSRIYGSYEDAQRFIRMVQSTERSLPALLKDLHQADEISNNHQFNNRQRRRWANLRSELARRISLFGTLSSQ